MKAGSCMILLLVGSKVIGRTVSVLLRIARSSVDGRQVFTTYDTDQQVLRSSVCKPWCIKVYIAA